MKIGERYQIREKQKFYKRQKVVETTQTPETTCIGKRHKYKKTACKLKMTRIIDDLKIGINMINIIRISKAQN